MCRLLPLFALALATGACGGRDARSPESRAVVAQRLEGSWVLTGFRANPPFEPMLERLLQAQFGMMTVVVEGRTMHARGIGVAATRTYEITEAQSQTFKAVLYDERGVPYHVAGQLQGNLLAFTSLDEPWQGNGQLQRQQ
jgi:hypothetical protein